MNVSFFDVTEISGDLISNEQLSRMHHRYYWAQGFCADKDVLEIACGTGPGLGLLFNIARSLSAGDIDKEILNVASKHYGSKFPIVEMDACNLPFEDSSKDVIILFEAIYYIENIQLFINECKRVLRNGGIVLIATANKDLSDFNPSPNSYIYLGTCGLFKLFTSNNFKCNLFGYLSVKEVSFIQKLLIPVKKIAVWFNLIPKTMRVKKFFKRLIFGRLILMPNELDGKEFSFVNPQVLSSQKPDKFHKVIYLQAKIQK